MVTILFRHLLTPIFFCGIFITSPAQNDSTKIIHSFNIVDSKLKTDTLPIYVLRIKKASFLVDTVTLNKINPDWIDRIVVLKNEKNKYMDPPPAKTTILIYFKRQYNEKVKQILKQ